MTGKIIGGIVSGIAALLAVGGLGFYLGNHYRIVPADQAAPPGNPTPEYSITTPPPTLAPPKLAASASTNRGDGPFTYRFTPGEEVKYTLIADISGTGVERDIGNGAIGLDFETAFTLATNTIGEYDVADLTLTFDDVQMTGKFMGDEVDLRHGPSGSSFRMPGVPQSQGAQSQLGDTPQLQFFDTPVDMSVAPDGRILSVSGAPGFEQVLAPEHLVAAAELPEANLQEGDTWETSFNFPIPGFNLAVPATATNSFDGYTTVHGQEVAVIRQVIDAQQTDGQINSPGALFGNAAGFTMPTFQVKGENYIFFDTKIGKLRQANMDLTVGLEFGDKLDAVKNLAGAFNNLLNELDGSRRGNSSQPATPLLDLGFRIQSTLEMQ